MGIRGETRACKGVTWAYEGCNMGLQGESHEPTRGVTWAYDGSDMGIRGV
jgi:hypothetical protein